MKILSKIAFIILGTLILSNYANAATTSKVASRQECNEAFCEFVKVGIGGAYYGVKANGADISGYAGYAAIDLREVLSMRLQFGVNGFVGGGKSTLKGTALSTLASSPRLLIYGLGVQMGVNIASKDTPLFVNLVLDIDAYNANPKNAMGLSRTLGMTGIALQGEIPTSQSTRIFYGAGYSWVFGVSYRFDDSKVVNVARKLSNYAVSANIGYEYDFDKGISFYTKILGKYQSIGAPSSLIYNGATISYPSSKNFSVGAEIGLGF